MFVGEAPGASENVLGRPFVGPAGKLLDAIIGRSVPVGVCYALTNLVGCIPRDLDGNKVGKPEHEDVMACSPRLAEFAELARSRLVVAVGAEAKMYLSPSSRIGRVITFPGDPYVVCIQHPAHILRMNVAQQGLEIQRCVVTLTNAVADLT